MDPQLQHHPHGEWRCPNASSVAFTYDAAGNRTRMVDTLGTSTYGYDALNRLTSYTNPFGKTVGSEYDAAGNRTAVLYPNGKQVTYSYDALNRLATVTDWLGKVSGIPMTTPATWWRC